MPRKNRTGVRGLNRDAQGYRIDLRYKLVDGTGARHIERLPVGTTLGAARTRAQWILGEALAGRPTRPLEVPRLLGECFAVYLEDCATNGRGDPAYKERHVARFLECWGADGAMGAVSELSVERFKRQRLGAPRRTRGSGVIGPGTVNRELVTLRHALGCFVRWGWIDTAPKVRLLREPPPRVRWLTDEERAALELELARRGAYGVRLRRVVLACALSGQRLGNVVGLRRVDVDFSARSIALPTTKSGRRHDVPISAALEVVLREALEHGSADAAARGGEPSEWVFLARGGNPYTANGAGGYFAKVAAAAGLVDFHLHDLRHDFATRIRRAGHGLDVIQGLLGHASPAMTQRYAHIGREERARAVEAVAAE